MGRNGSVRSAHRAAGLSFGQSDHVVRSKPPCVELHEAVASTMHRFAAKRFMEISLSLDENRSVPRARPFRALLIGRRKEARSSEAEGRGELILTWHL